MDEKECSVLVVGAAKSGTSAIYSMVKKALPDALTVYEPGTAAQMEFIRDASYANKVAKILYQKYANKIELLEWFDHKIHIVRDPRDIVVSWLLYTPLLHDNHLNEALIGELRTKLQQKEADPKSVSMIELGDVLAGHGIVQKSARNYRQEFEFAKLYQSHFPDSLLLKYDQILVGDFSSLEERLGFSISNTERVSAHLKFNERQKKSGAWRDWFTPQDVDHFRPLLSPFIDHFDFENDWDLNENPVILPKHSSEYLAKNVEHLKKYPNRFGHLKDEEFYTEGYLQHLKYAAADGAEGAMLELGLAHLAGYGVAEKSKALFERYTKEAVDRRNPLGLIYFGVARERNILTDDFGVSEPFKAAIAQTGRVRGRKWIANVRKFFDGLPVAEE